MWSTRQAAARTRSVALVLGVLNRRRELRRHDGWSRAQLLDHQERQLARLRTWAYARSPFYRRFHAGLQDRPLSELPVLSKAALMEHFDELVTAPAVRLADVEAHLSSLRSDALFRGRYYVAATAGTTGRRGVFLWDTSEWKQVLVSYNRAFDWAGSTAGPAHRVRTAIVSSTDPTHQSARVGASIHSPWLPTLRLDSGDALPEIVARLDAWRPQMLIGYASMLRLLATEQLAGRLRISPRFVFSASEVLTDATRRLATAAWGRPPHDVYAATETAGLAAECGRHPGLHLFEDLVICEVVGSDGRPVPPGVYGATVLVSVLFSRTLPLIRYAMSDSVALAPGHACPCGRPYALITGIQGREQEALSLPTSHGGVRAVQPVVFHHVMDEVDAAGWQVVHRPGGLEILLARPRDLDPQALVVRLRSALAAQGVTPPPITVRVVPAIPRTALGKAPLITEARS
ncbi:MAG TPA: hypothetical protein VD813_11020 [Pseudonocardia sp.]|nr:hypothetical protein [Pseudonocardia sp.]